MGKEVSPQQKKTKKRKGVSILRIVTDERFRIVLSFLMLGFAFLLLVSQISYFFTWKTDQSFSWAEAWKNPDIQVENWAGKTGATLAKLTMNRWFGIPAVTFPFLIALIGLRLLKIKLLPLGRTFLATVLTVIITSVWLGFFSGSNEFLGSGLGGNHGHYMSILLVSLLGKIGTIILLLIISATILFYFSERSFGTAKSVSRKFIFSRFRSGQDNHATGEANTEPEMEEMIFPDLANGYSPENSQNLRNETEPEEKLIPETEKFTVRNIHHPVQVTSPEDPVHMTVEGQNEEEEMDGELDSIPQEDYDPTMDLSSFKLPPIDLLEKHDSGNSTVTKEELLNNKNKIVETLGHYKIQIDKIKATIGPTVTLYEIVPAPGVRISKIKNLEDDIALNLSALGIRIIAPIPGRGTIGIEVPNQTPEIVSMRSLLVSKKFQESEYDLAIALGKTISNETYVFDLAKMPHLLVAGATGQGKSVGLNAIIASLLYKKHPSQLKFVLIDPKKVELTLYSRIENHYLAKIPDSEEAIITDTQKVIYTLNSLTIEMDQRYDLLKKAQVRNIKEYNRKFIKHSLNPENGHRYMPYIVVVIDEFADLIMTAGREVETPLARLAQLARAIGIHLVIATQRPTTNIITGVIKANFPARIAFRVTSMVDSRTILDTPGANQLIGRGDLLFAPGSDLIRLQCAFIDIPELDKITGFIGEQRGFPTPYFLPEYIDETSSDGLLDVDLTKRDSLFNDAARLVVAHQQGSTSLIQRKFSIGYNRAGRIVDQLEAAGIVGSFEGSKARQVMFPDEYSLEQYLRTLDE
jgi:DNA segregation ATPase FtsK/SpoIIIE, S-DNA-T family